MSRLALPIVVSAVVLLGVVALLTQRGAHRGMAPTGTPAPAVPPLGGKSSPADQLSAAPALQRSQFQPDGSLGSTVDLASFQGKNAVLVNFWATWCPPCEKELPDFVQLQAEFPDLVILAVNRGEPRDAQSTYLRDRDLLTAPIRFLDDPEDSAYRAFGGFGMPVTAFITKDGKLAFVKSGLMALDEMRDRTRTLLGGP